MNHQTVISHTKKELEKLIQKSNADFRRQLSGEKKNVAYGAKWADKSERGKLNRDLQEHIRYNAVILSQHGQIVKHAIADGITVPRKVADEYGLVN
jgi:tyrosyl-tRNA synthetase